MCLSTVYKETDAGLEEVATQISDITTDGSTVTLTDIIGMVTEIPGILKNVDLIGGKVIVKAV